MSDEGRVTSDPPSRPGADYGVTSEGQRGTPETDAAILVVPLWVECDDPIPTEVVLPEVARRIEHGRETAKHNAVRLMSEKIALESKLAEARAERDEFLRQRDVCIAEAVKVAERAGRWRGYAEGLAAELNNIAAAKPSQWGDMVDQFRPWAQNRARHALAELERLNAGDAAAGDPPKADRLSRPPGEDGR